MTDLSQSTDARPGSQEKITIMMERLESGLPLHIPGDLKLPSGWDECRKSVFEIAEVSVEEVPFE